MNRLFRMLVVTFPLFAVGCMVESGEDPTVSSSQELTAVHRADPALNQVANVHPSVLVNSFQDAEVNEAGGTVTVPKPPPPLGCGVLSDRDFSVAQDGPDGGTCTFRATTSNCRSAGDGNCTCELTGTSETGDCKGDGSTTTFDNPAQTQGSGL